MKIVRLLKLSYLLSFFCSNMTVAALAENEDFKLTANSTSINMQSGLTQFSDDVVINHGNLKIIAATLSQQQDTSKKQEKMQLTGSPAKIQFKRENSSLLTTIEAENILFYPDLGILKVSGKSKLQISENDQLQTVIRATFISLKLSTKKIETIHAEGAPLYYYLSGGNGKDDITATAEKLALNQKTGDVELFNASVKQKNDEFRAGLILVDGATGNLSASGGKNNVRPSLSIELDEELINSNKKQDKKP